MHLLVQSGGILALDKLKPSANISVVTEEPQKHGLTANERLLVKSNLERIKVGAAEVIRVRDRVAPAMPIDASVSAISSSAVDLRLR